MQTPPTMLEYDDIQGLVLRGYARLPEACYYLLHIREPELFKSWLASLLDGHRITAANERPSTGRGAFNIAFTASGLRALDVEPDPKAGERDGFSLEFREGLTHPDRSRLLGDRDGNAPEHWQWGDFDEARAATTSAVAGVDCICLTFAAHRGAGEGSLAALWDALKPPLDAAEVRFVMPAWLDAESTEPFGFRDGLSQPIIRYTAREYASVGPERALHVVEPGEFLLGYENQSGHMPISPSVKPQRDRGGRLRPLENHPRVDRRSFSPDLRDFGRNGSYMVVRQLRQDVDAFQRFIRANAATSAERDRLAATMVGRWPNGEPLSRSPQQPPPRPGDNAFGYFADDRHGYRCPPGAHVRRANPRDALAHDDAGMGRAIARANSHRLLRRGRRYGPRPDVEPMALDAPRISDHEVGLAFVAFNASLRGQFEFVQQTWLNNENFAGLAVERDPLNGCPAGAFTLPQAEGGHQRVQLQQFVQVVGGGYFFMPGLAALRCLAD